METRREDVITGLRELAQFLEDHPDMPIPYIPEFSHCVMATDDAAGVAEVEQIAAALGVGIGSGSHPNACREFAGLKYRAFYVFHEDVCAWDALTSYSGSVQPDDEPAETAAATA